MLSDWFNLLGWPQIIRSDNGPQFRSNMIAGAEEENSSKGEDNGVIHHGSSAKHAPQTMM